METKPANNMSAHRDNLRAPRHWPLWAALGAARLMTGLPLSGRRFVGRALGRALYYLGRTRRRVAATNLRLCFPEWGEARRARLVKKSFALYGAGVLEGMATWWGGDRALGRVEYTGLAHLRRAMAGGRGVILLGCHFNTLEVGGRLLGRAVAGGIDAMHRRHENPVFNHVMERGRRASTHGALFDRADKGDILRMLRGLKKGRAVWYAPDQDYGRGLSVFVPFMGVPAATITTTSRWAKMTGAAVVPFFIDRIDGGFRVRVSPPLEGFPTGDTEADATRINRVIEREVMRAPENYIWAHRRFRSRPPGQPSVY